MDYKITWTEQQQSLVYEMYDDEVVIKVRVDDSELEECKKRSWHRTQRWQVMNQQK